MGRMEKRGRESESEETILTHTFNIRRHIKNGFALIINNIEFQNKNVSKRDGAVNDEIRFTKVMEIFGFTVEKIRDGKVDDIIQEIEKAATMDHSEHDCILILVNTHGMTGGILFASDMKHYNVHDVWSPFLKNTNLNHLPKIFIFQACRGDAEDQGINFGLLNSNISTPGSSRSEISTTIIDNTSKSDKNGDDEVISSQSSQKKIKCGFVSELHPNYRDVLTAYSTVENHVSWRDCNSGTHYVQSLCSVLEEENDLDLLSLLTRVHREVSKKFAVPQEIELQLAGVLMKQAPSLTSSLTYKIFLQKIAINEQSIE